MVTLDKEEAHIDMDCVPVEGDLDGTACLRLDDPLTAQGVFVIPRPPGRQDDATGGRKMAPAGGCTEQRDKNREQLLTSPLQNPQSGCNTL